MRKPLVKICGITQAEQAEQAVLAGADCIGLIFFSGSKRYVTLEQARPIVSATKKQGAVPVAVFVDADAEKILSIVSALNINTVQLHGGIAKKAVLPDDLHRIYVIGVNAKGQLCEDFSTVTEKLNPARDMILLDYEQPGIGQTYPIPSIVNPNDFRIVLAGGLTPENVADRFSQGEFSGVDVSSGVEDVPGQKSSQKIIAFIRQLRGEYVDT